MPPRAYYNEFDPKAAAWLRELISRGLIADGDVDERSITDVQPEDLEGYTQVHLFAGIGVWSYALRLAQWPDSLPVWTGSCPCPPFSSAGKGQRCPECGSKSNLCHPSRTGYFICRDCGCSRHADERHLWPEFSRLIRECRPSIVFGEQVASKDGRLWLDVVSADLENASYGVAGADLCAAGDGAPHIRQRLFFGAADLGPLLSGELGNSLRLVHGVEPGLEGQPGHVVDRDEPGRIDTDEDRSASSAGGSCGMGNASHEPRERDAGSVLGTEAPEHGARVSEDGREPDGPESSSASVPGRMGDTELLGCDPGFPGDAGAAEGARSECRDEPDRPSAGLPGRPSPTSGFWGDADWLRGVDGKWRPVEPGTSPLADGPAARVGRLRGYGNAIVSETAKGFISDFRGSIQALTEIDRFLEDA